MQARCGTAGSTVDHNAILVDYTADPTDDHIGCVAFMQAPGDNNAAAVDFYVDAVGNNIRPVAVMQPLGSTIQPL